MTELQALEKWLNDSLMGSAGVVAVVDDRVYADLVPQTGGYPALVWQILAGEDVNVQMGSRCGYRALVQIKAIDKGHNRAPLYAVLDAVETVVKTHAEIGGYEIDGFRRDTMGDKFEDKGVIWSQVVSTFEVWLKILP